MCIQRFLSIPRAQQISFIVGYRSYLMSSSSVWLKKNVQRCQCSWSIIVRFSFSHFFYLIFTHFTHDANVIWYTHHRTDVSRISYHATAFCNGTLWILNSVSMYHKYGMYRVRVATIRWYKTISHFSTFSGTVCVCGVCIHTKTNLWIHKIFIVIPQCFARDLKSYIWFFRSFYMMLTNNGRLTEDFTRNGGWESIWKSVNNNTCNNAFFNKHRVWLKSDWTIFNIAKEMTLATKIATMFHRAKSTFIRFAVDFFNIVNCLCMILFGKKERKSFIFDCSSIMNENWIFTIWFLNSWFLTTFYHLQEWCSVLNHEFLFTVQKMFLFFKKKKTLQQK